MRLTLRCAAAVALLIAWLVAVPTVATAQTLSNTTTLSAAIDAAQNTFVVGSTANISATRTGAWKLFIPTTGEIMDVTAIPVSGTVQVRRGSEGTFVLAAASGATVVIIYGDQITDKPMGGSCTRGSGYARYSPLVSRAIPGEIYVCRSSLWQTTNSRVVTYNSLAPFTN